jgi:toxin HigB-1
MIRSFRCRDTEELFGLKRNRRWIAIERPALRKLVQLDIAQTIDDMRSPPGNRLEPLSGDRNGQWGIRINGQFRLCFRWTADGPADVEIVDYH